jgi:hypothetical protein
MVLVRKLRYVTKLECNMEGGENKVRSVENEDFG